MRKLSICILLTCMLWQPASAKRQEYISYFLTAKRAGVAIGQAVGVALALAFGGAPQTSDPVNTALMMITPEFRKKQLDAYNAKVQKKIDKLNKKISKAQTKSKDIEEYKAKFNDEKYRLFKDPVWNQDEELVSFIVLPIDAGAPFLVDNFRVTDQTGVGSVCKPALTEKINFSALDKEYLDEIYMVDLNDHISVGLKTSYDPKCIIKDTATQYIMTINGGRLDNFDLDFRLSQAIKNVIRDDFEILE
ncbi:MAG: hypothetical protein O3C63_08905 [Cyanobacteria bacterium]|nr:hypothetical protein [Cyanobacteriota bacterium]MDA1020705.1 hypothetical protein [Cyanobacteriota bacterium]